MDEQDLPIVQIRQEYVIRLVYSYGETKDVIGFGHYSEAEEYVQQLVEKGLATRG